MLNHSKIKTTLSSQLLFTIDLFNNTVDSLITNSTLTPKNQKDYYNKPNKRVLRLLEFLQEEPHEYLERIYMHQRDKRIPEQSLNKKDEGLNGDITITRGPNQPSEISSIR